MTIEKFPTPKKTVGQASASLLKNGEDSYVPQELQQSIHRGDNSKKTYEEEVHETIERARKDSAIEGSFYVIVLFRKERLLKNIIRQMFFYRKSCPSPEYDQTVYFYNRLEDKLEFVWTVPNNATCQYMHLQEKEIIASQSELSEFVKDFKSGKLEEIAAWRNGELV